MNSVSLNSTGSCSFFYNCSVALEYLCAAHYSNFQRRMALEDIREQHEPRLPCITLKFLPATPWTGLNIICPYVSYKCYRHTNRKKTNLCHDVERFTVIFIFWHCNVSFQLCLFIHKENFFSTLWSYSYTEAWKKNQRLCWNKYSRLWWHFQLNILLLIHIWNCVQRNFPLNNDLPLANFWHARMFTKTQVIIV